MHAPSINQQQWTEPQAPRRGVQFPASTASCIRLKRLLDRYQSSVVAATQLMPGPLWRLAALDSLVGCVGKPCSQAMAGLQQHAAHIALHSRFPWYPRRTVTVEFVFAVVRTCGR